MKLRLPALVLAVAALLPAQRKNFSFQDACFKNPTLPYCRDRDYAVKPTKRADPSPAGPASSNGYGPSPQPWRSASSVITVGAIDWRFVDPLADAVLALDFSRVSTSALAHNLIAQSGADASTFKALSGVSRLALSIRDGRTVMLITGPATDGVPAALENGWKSTPIIGGGLLLGDADAVDQAAQRMAFDFPPSEITRLARQHDAADFVAIGSARRMGPEAVAAGMKRFAIAATMQDGLISQTILEFNETASASALNAWAAKLQGATVDGHSIRLTMSLEAQTAPAAINEIATGLLGQQMATLVKAARYLPVRSTNTTPHSRPVIYGLDDGPREVKQ